MLRQPLILVGLPGAGKSTVGRAVASRLQVDFLDFDDQLVARTGLTIPELFAQQGESAFRKLELRLTAELRDGSPAVWAPGGGWVTAPGAMALVAGRSCMIHLEVSSSQALARLESDDSIRPLLAVPDPAAALQRLWQARAALYATAAHRVNTEVLSLEEVVDRVCRLARDHASDPDPS